MTTLDSLSLETLGLQPASSRYLLARELRTVGAILAWDPEPLAGRSATRSDLLGACRRLLGRYPGEGRLEAFIARLNALESRPRPEPELPDLSPRLRDVYRTLSLRAHPLPLRELLRVANQEHSRAAAVAEIRQSPALVIYPFGAHNWTGLTDWGLRGYRRAARAAWNVLPLHLQHLQTEQRLHELPTLAWQALRDIAAEQRDDELLAVALEQLTAQASATAVAVAEAPPVSREEETERVHFEQSLKEAVGRLEMEPALFAGLAPETAYRGAVEAVLRAAQDLPRPFSLAELRLNLADRRWLETWARSMPAFVARGWLASGSRTTLAGQRWSDAECLGVLLLCLASEVGRVRAREGHIWPVVHACFEKATRDELFAGGQPRAATREAIEAGARRLGVRNAFGQEGTQSWYLTIFLQFGFTRQAIPALPFWLSAGEHASEAVNRLQEDCEAFQTLWKDLRSYRHGRLPRARAEASLRANPFVLEAWIPEILEHAPRSVDSEELEQMVDEELPVFGGPRLAWNGTDTPRLLVPLRNLDGQGLTESGYEVLVEGQPAGRVVLQPSGSYEAEPPELEVSLDSPYATVELEGLEGGDRREFDLVLWDNDEEVQVFDGVDGHRLRPQEKLATRRDYTFWLHEGVSLRPEPDRSRTLPNGQGRLIRLEGGWSPETCLVADGVEIRSLVVEHTPDWVRDTRLVLLEDRKTPYRLGNRVALAVVGLPSGARIVSARCCRQPLTFRQGALGAWDLEVELPAELTGPTLSTALVVEHQNRRHRFSTSTRVPILDAAIHLDEHWRPFRGLRRLSTRQLERAQVRFFLGEEKTSFGLMEGNVFVQRPRRRVGRLAPLGGYGGPLELREGPYNSPEDGLVLVREVVHQGLIERVERLEETVEITLHRPLEAGPDHFVLVWHSTGETEAFMADELAQSRGLVWRCELEQVPAGTVAVAIGYEDAWQGTGWEQGFTVPWEASEPRTTAGLLRWMHFPLLSQPWKRLTRQLVGDDPLACLRAWLFDRSVQGVAGRLSFEESEGWFAVLRELFANFPVEEPMAYELWTALLQDTGLSWQELFHRLLVADPILALKLANQAPFFKLVGGWRILRDELAGVENGARLDRGFEELERQAARTMGTSPYFPRRLCERIVANDLSDHDRRNLYQACQVPDFSRFLAVMLFDRWCGQKKTTRPVVEKKAGPRWRRVPKCQS